jgi:hypothetical protein
MEDGRRQGSAGSPGRNGAPLVSLFGTLVAVIALASCTSFTSSSSASAPVGAVTPPTGTLTTYPPGIQAGFLSACESHYSSGAAPSVTTTTSAAAVQYCGCVLTWYETHLTLGQIRSLESQLAQGKTSPYVAESQQACLSG